MIIAALSLGPANAETVPCPKAVPSPSWKPKEKPACIVILRGLNGLRLSVSCGGVARKRRAAVAEAEGHKSDAAAIIY